MPTPHAPPFRSARLIWLGFFQAVTGLALIAVGYRDQQAFRLAWTTEQLLILYTCGTGLIWAGWICPQRPRLTLSAGLAVAGLGSVWLAWGPDWSPALVGAFAVALVCLGALGCVVKPCRPWAGVVTAGLLLATVVQLPANSSAERVRGEFHSSLPAQVDPGTPFDLQPVFPGLAFDAPLFAATPPNQPETLAVAERAGRIWLAERASEEPTRTLLLDIRDRVLFTPYSEQGLFCFAFHPQFANARSEHQGELFVSYTATGDGTPSIRLSRFRVRQGVVDPDTELVLIDQRKPGKYHHGGGLQFGPDGFLYFGIGDGSEPERNGQRIDLDLYSGILRLDVDCQGSDVSHPPPRSPRTARTQGYYIPHDNPFVGEPDVLEEFYAFGIRNPWRFAFDAETGELWGTDIGSWQREEINRIPAGGNLGWPAAEGSLLHDPALVPRSDQGHWTEPIHEYAHDGLLGCVIGGGVYCGDRLPELRGRYIFLDYPTGQVFALRPDHSGRDLLATVDPAVGKAVSFANGPEGEVFLCVVRAMGQGPGMVYRLVPTEPKLPNQLPERLSQTGLFQDLVTLTPHPAFVAYDLKVPLWADGAEKRRWIALPPGERIAGRPQEGWQFPPGTVFLKHFDLPTDERAPSQWRRLETRVLVIQENGDFYAVTYRWDEDGTDATVVHDAVRESLHVTRADGTSETRLWTYPSRSDCRQCHHPSPSAILGFTPEQLDRPVPGPDGHPTEQLSLLVSMGLFVESWDRSDLWSLPKLAGLDDSWASIDQRVRSYLHVHCATCHTPERQPPTRFVADYDHPHLPRGHVNISSSDESYFYYRMTTEDMEERMPPIGRHQADPQAAEAVHQWLAGFGPTTRLMAVSAIVLRLVAILTLGMLLTRLCSPGYAVLAVLTTIAVSTGRLPDTVAFELNLVLSLMVVGAWVVVCLGDRDGGSTRVELPAVPARWRRGLGLLAVLLGVPLVLATGPTGPLLAVCLGSCVGCAGLLGWVIVAAWRKGDRRLLSVAILASVSVVGATLVALSWVRWELIAFPGLALLLAFGFHHEDRAWRRGLLVGCGVLIVLGVVQHADTVSYGWGWSP